MGKLRVAWRMLVALSRQTLALQKNHFPGYLEGGALIFGFVLAGIIWWRQWPTGYAVGVLSVVAAIMTFSKPTETQKVAVALLSALLFYVETQAIRRDRAQQDIQHANEQASLNERFKRILAENRRGLERILAEASSGFGTVQSGMDKVLDKEVQLSSQAASNLAAANRSLLNLTGAGSIPIIVPQTSPIYPALPLVVHNEGRYALTSVTVHLTWMVPIATVPNGEVRNLINKSYEIGTIAPGAFSPFDFEFLPHLSSNYDLLMARISAQNRTFEEYLAFRHKGESVAYQYKIDVFALPATDVNGRPKHEAKKLVFSQDWHD